jgi:hypothetical protein
VWNYIDRWLSTGTAPRDTVSVTGLNLNILEGSHVSFPASSVPTDPTGGVWRCRKDKGQKTDMQKGGARCAGRSDGDAQQPHCFFFL